MEGNKGLIVLGIILLTVGLVALFYSAIGTVTPYRNVGIILVVAGIVFIEIGRLYPAHKTLSPRTNQSNRKQTSKK